MPSVAQATAIQRAERRAKTRSSTRASILKAARNVAARDGAANLSLRAVAAEAGFAPAALYGYFASKNELLIALAAEDLVGLARAMRDADGDSPARLSSVASAALVFLQATETCAAAPAALPPQPGASEAERLFNGRLIAVLRVLSDAAGRDANSREAQVDIVLLAAALTGITVFARTGRLDALGFSTADLIGAIDRRFSAPRS